ncbi:Myb-like DNA-binding domain containing protein [Entamoeba marina]
MSTFGKAAGSIWRNTEDEVLKAAVMKYGKNEWARISSLITGKSPQQCKARCQEEEKLLHMVKIFPSQWQTISKGVGRTATQCIEKYNQLKDEASGQDNLALRENEMNEIMPEARPALKDRVDLDDDEIEMLNEARARLANTKGKKEKRKERLMMFKQTAYAAELQKKRELRAAGIEVGALKKPKGPDYNASVPFMRTAPTGKFDPKIDRKPPKKPSFIGKEV